MSADVGILLDRVGMLRHVERLLREAAQPDLADAVKERRAQVSSDLAAARQAEAKAAAR